MSSTFNESCAIYFGDILSLFKSIKCFFVFCFVCFVWFFKALVRLPFKTKSRTQFTKGTYFIRTTLRQIQGLRRGWIEGVFKIGTILPFIFSNSWRAIFPNLTSCSDNAAVIKSLVHYCYERIIV